MNARSRARAAVASNPVLIGAATILVVAVAVFLAYNANHGLPFVPTYQLTAQLPDAANIVKGNDVRIGGSRVGQVSDLRPHVNRNGTLTALLTLKLDKRVEPLPADSRILVRARSALGLKYLEITPGRSPRTLPDGATLPLRNAVPRPVEVDEVLNTFNGPTRAAVRENLVNFGDALAGRGTSLNQAVRDLDPLLRHLVPVGANLSDPRTRLAAFVIALDRAARVVAPAAQAQGDLVRNLDVTFAALARVADPYIEQAIARGPGTLDTATRSLGLQRPFLAHAAALFADLGPGARALPSTAPVLSGALAVGTPALRRSLALNGRLQGALATLDTVVSDPLARMGIRGLRDLATSLDPTLARLTPTQTVCNYVTLWFRNVASLLSVGDANGTWERFNIVLSPSGPNSEGGVSNAPANGPGIDNHVHVDPYPNTAAPGEPRECEAANEPYLAGRTLLTNVPGNQGTAHDATTIDRSGTSPPSP